MNQPLQNYLETLNTRELVFFNQFRKPEFVRSSQVQIERELQQRGLTEALRTQILNTQFTEAPDNCLRCNAQFFSGEVEIDVRIVGYAMQEYETHTRRCRICGFNPDKHPKGTIKNWWKRMFRIGSSY